MKRFSLAALAAFAALVTAGLAGLSSGEASVKHDHAMHASPAAATRTTAADLRVTLDRLLGEHALLAIATTQRGLQGGKEFPALARALDRNSVQLANTIGSVFGKAARQKFLNGRLMWRDHIRFFVQYTVALAKKNKAGQRRAVGNLRGYIEAFSAFLSSATGLPQSALRKSITTHVMQLKGQLDAYANGRYARSYTVSRAAYRHMFMTGDALAGAIARKFPGRYPSS